MSNDKKNLSDEVVKLMNEKVEKIRQLNDIKIEVCGSWIWVSGDTKKYKDILKELKFVWSPLKKMWYWRNEKNKVYNRKSHSIEEIREKYGSKKVTYNF